MSIGDNYIIVAPDSTGGKVIGICAVGLAEIADTDNRTAGHRRIVNDNST